MESEQTVPLLYLYALRFSVHLTLISIFEALFFWKFVVKTEDTALTQVIESYAASLMNGCANLTYMQRDILRDFVDDSFNGTATDALTAYMQREVYNRILFRNSWLICGCLGLTCTSLVAVGFIKGYPVDWKIIAGDNLALVTLLGMYEWIFFSNIVLKYKTISQQELNGIILDQFNAQC